VTGARGAVPDQPARTWRDAAGAWLGIGTAPGALVLGAQIGGRHGGDLPVAVLLTGGAVMAALLIAQGRLGLRRPAGEDASLAELTRRYFPAVAELAITGLLAAAMTGWFGFNLGLGGAAVGALTGLPDAAGVALLAIPTVGVLLAGQRTWNAVAIGTTLSAIVLIAVVAVRLSPPRPPLSLAAPGLAGDLAGFIGYVAVFAVRSPDFTVGLGGRRDLLRCVALLVGPALAAVVVGAGVAAASGSTDIVAVLAGPDGLPVANLFVAAAVLAPTMAAVYSGALAVRRLVEALPALPSPSALSPRSFLSPRAARPPGAARSPRSVWPPYWACVLVIAAPGTVLAVMRIDRLLLDWLTLLAATLPALIAPVAAEVARRRRGRAPRPVPTWAWAPAAGMALALTLAGYPAAATAGLGVSILTAAGHLALQMWRERRPGGERA
jgi:cytosine permease